MQGRRMHRMATAMFAVMTTMPAVPLSALAQAGGGNGELAYVDSPAGRAVADPARADGGGPPPRIAAPALPPASAPAGVPALPRPAGPVHDPSRRPPFATPAQQAGAGMAQDAGALLDAAMQRQLPSHDGPAGAPAPGFGSLPEPIAPPASPAGP